MSTIISRQLPLVALLFGLASTGQALAHAHLKSAVPPVGGKVATAPGELDLTFSEGLNLRFTGLTLTGPGKAPVATGAPALAPGGTTTLVVPVGTPLAAGSYGVDWHALSTDGHKTSGHYVFTVGP